MPLISFKILNFHTSLMTTGLLPGVSPVCAEMLWGYGRWMSSFGQKDDSEAATKAVSNRSPLPSHNVPRASGIVGSWSIFQLISVAQCRPSLDYLKLVNLCLRHQRWNQSDTTLSLGKRYTPRFCWALWERQEPIRITGRMSNLVRETNHFIYCNAGIFNRKLKVIEMIPTELNNPKFTTKQPTSSGFPFFSFFVWCSHRNCIRLFTPLLTLLQSTTQTDLFTQYLF